MDLPLTPPKKVYKRKKRKKGMGLEEKYGKSSVNYL